MKRFLVLLGHVVIVGFCVLAAIALNRLLISRLVMPAIAGLLLLVVYAPGWIWPPAKRLPVRLGITALLIAATHVMLDRWWGIAD
jgi:hypothetical protein